MRRRLWRAWDPPPDLLVSDWADRERKLSREASAEHGDFHMNRTPYMREPVDSVLDPAADEIWFMKSAQVAYTENGINVLGYFIDQDPAPMMMIQPTLAMAEAVSKDRISTAIRDSPALSRAIDDKSKTSGNTILHKKFAGGHLTLAGANSPASLASRPIRGLMVDEPDRFPASAGDEGDPIKLGQKRQITFWNRWFFAGGTPTIAGISRIEKGFNRGDRRKYFVPCPKCKELVELLPERLCRDEEAAEFGQIQCPECEKWIEERRKLSMIRDKAAGGRAEWRATSKVGEPGIRSYWIWAGYSPWVAWRQIAREWNECEGDPELIKPFTNTVLGRTYEEKGEAPDHEDLMKRRENYEPGGIPDEVVAVTGGGDVQHDRIEFEVVGWGAGEESWSIDYRTIWGNTAEAKVWEDLDTYLQTARFTRLDGVALKVKAFFIDASDGQRSDHVYKWARGKRYRNIFACKGENNPGRPIVSRVSKLKKQRLSLVLVGTDTAKSLIYERLEMKGSGAGRCHFPLTYGPKYFEMLTAEELIVEYKAGNPVMRWVLRTIEGEADGSERIDKKGRKLKRNEALDCRVYALAALRNLPFDLNALARRSRKKKAAASDEEEAAPAAKARTGKKKAAARKRPASRRGKKGGFITG